MVWVFNMHYCLAIVMPDSSNRDCKRIVVTVEMERQVSTLV